MPTSRRTSSIFLRSSVSSMPSTMTRPLLPVLDAVDAAQQRRLAAAGRAADDDALAAHDLEVDVAQHVEAAEPLVQADDLDRDLVLGRAHVERDVPVDRPRWCLASVAHVVNPVSARPLGVQAAAPWTTRSATCRS